MSFINAIAAAPEGIDFISYKDDHGTWVIVRRILNEHRVIAQLDELAYPIFVSGVASRCMSLYSYESRMCIVGTVAQLDDDVFTDETPGEGYRYRDHAGQGEA